MGIRFLCPNGHKLNVKSDLAGKRASCPECGAKLLIPATSAESLAAPAAIVVAPSLPPGAVWYLRTTGGEQLGPATEVQFSSWITNGRVTADAHVWRDGWAEWKLAREAADLLPVPLAAVVAPARPAVAADEIVDSPPAETTSTSLSDLDPTPAQTVLSDTIVPGPAAATYVHQRSRSKKLQLTLAVVMLAAVVVLAGVLLWVIRSNTTATAPISFWDQSGVHCALGDC